MFKSIIYRLYAFIITFAITFFVTGNIKISATIGFFESIVKIVTYYWFDIFWERVKKNKTVL